LGFTKEKDPVKIERDLMNEVLEERWIAFSHQVIHFGRQICKSQRPRCGECFLVELCPHAHSNRVER